MNPNTSPADDRRDGGKSQCFEARILNNAPRDEKTIVVVTGASRGAGRGIAIAFRAVGCTVYVDRGDLEKPGDATSCGNHP